MSFVLDFHCITQSTVHQHKFYMLVAKDSVILYNGIQQKEGQERNASNDLKNQLEEGTYMRRVPEKGSSGARMDRPEQEDEYEGAFDIGRFGDQ